MTEQKIIRLYDIPRMSRIYCEASDGSAYITFDHLDGMYSYCLTEKGTVVYLWGNQPLVKEGDGYRMADELTKGVL